MVVTRKDVRFYLMKALQNMGYKVNDTYQESLQPGELSVVYDHIDFEQETTHEYFARMYMHIIMDLDNSEDLPYTIMKIIGKTQAYIEKSGAPDCTSFKYGQPYTDNGSFGNTIRVIIPAEWFTYINIYEE